jgi:hypothetical protein
MKPIITFIALATLTANLAATSIKSQDSHDVESNNGKFKLHVDSKKEAHKVTGAFGPGLEAWKFKHEVWNHRFFVSDDGESAAVVHWSWIQDYSLNEPAVAIYGRDGAKRTYTYAEISKPKKPAPGTIGPIGDFWRIWRGEATIKGDLLTIAVEGGKPLVIDLKNPKAVPPHEEKKKATDENKEAPQAGNACERVDADNPTTEPKVPDTWKRYGTEQFELKKGLRMYHAEGTIVVDHDKGVTPDGFHGEELLYMQLERAGNAQKVFAGIRNEKQAKELCELLMHGAIVDDAKAYQGLLKVHRDAGYEQLVKDGELSFDRVAKPIDGGFQVEFTALHLPRTMGAESIVARYKFIVGKDASVKVKSTPYLKGVTLNWQTIMLNTKEAQEREAKKQARVAKFVRDCQRLCPNKLPILPKG